MTVLQLARTGLGAFGPESCRFMIFVFVYRPLWTYLVICLLYSLPWVGRGELAMSMIRRHRKSNLLNSMSPSYKDRRQTRRGLYPFFLDKIVKYFEPLVLQDTAGYYRNSLESTTLKIQHGYGCANSNLKQYWTSSILLQIST